MFFLFRVPSRIWGFLGMGPGMVTTLPSRYDVTLTCYMTQFINCILKVKQHMLDLNISRVTELHYTNCTGAHSALRIKIDFEDFGTDPYFKVGSLVLLFKVKT